MKIGSVDHEGRAHLATNAGDVLVLLAEALGDMVDAATCHADALVTVELVVTAKDARRLPVAGTVFRPVTRRIQWETMCGGFNYSANFDESIGRRGKSKVACPEAPTFFTKRPGVAQGGAGRDLRLRLRRPGVAVRSAA